MKFSLQRMKTAGIIAAMSLLVGACATSPPEQLEDARSTYEQAKQSNAAQYAPTELAQARKSLVRAERAFEEDGDTEVTRTLAYIAHRQAREAIAQGQVNHLVTAREAKQQELVQRTDQARQQFQRELVRQRQMNQMSAQQLEQQRTQLEQQRQRLEQQRERLQQQDQSAQQLRQSEDQIRQRERDYEAAIQRLEVEIERREHAESQLDEAMTKLEDIATVRQEEGRGQVITLDNSVLFEVGKSELLPNARQRLNQVADVLKVQETRSITIEGHTDSTGSNELNERLSKERAQSVSDYLVSRGVPAERVETAGYGEERPIAGNQSPEGRAMNRRVEIVLPIDEAVGGGPDQQNNQELKEDLQEMQKEQEMRNEQDLQEQEDLQDEQQRMEEMEPSEREMIEPSEPAEPSDEDFEADEPEDEEMLDGEPERSPME